MTTAKKSAKRHETTAAASHATHEGDQTMTTTKTTHATNANHATPEGETTMTTTKATHAETTPAPTASTEAATLPAAVAAPPPTPPVAAPSPRVAATLAYIQTCTALLDQLDAAFPPGESLTALDKKRKAKARKGSERFTPQLVALAKQHGVNLSLVPLDAISNAHTEAMALVPLQKRMEATTSRAASRMFTLQSAAWDGSAKLYSVLKRLSKDSGDIETGLAPVEQFFNHRHPLVAKKHPKTKKGKAALAAEKAAEKAAAGGAPVATPGATPGATPEAPVPAPVAPPAAGGTTHA